MAMGFSGKYGQKENAEKEKNEITKEPGNRNGGSTVSAETALYSCFRFFLFIIWPLV